MEYVFINGIQIAVNIGAGVFRILSYTFYQNTNHCNSVT